MLKVVYVTFISVLLLGCQSTKSSNDNKLLIDSTFKSVSISKPKGINEVTFEDQDSLESFQSIFSSAGKEPGIVDMADPEFYLTVNYDKGTHQDLYVWIGEKGQRSTFMKIEETHTIYAVSEEKTDQLIELVESIVNYE